MTERALTACFPTTPNAIEKVVIKGKLDDAAS